MTYNSKQKFLQNADDLFGSNPGLLSIQREDTLQLCDPKKDPPFFNLFVEKRHIDNLGTPSLDDESRLEVIY